MNKQHFRTLAVAFLDHVFKQIDLKLFKDHWFIDHLCFRSETIEDYEKFKAMFLEWGELLIESEVGGRPISTFKLNEPISYQHYQISLLELPAPKKGKLTANGFEHIEVVCDESFADIKKRFQAGKFSDSGLQKVFNRELEMELEGCAIKFHHLSLGTVIKIEKQETSFKALMNSKLLQIYQQNDPFVLEDGKTILLQGPDQIVSLKHEGVEFVLKFQGRPVTEQKEFKDFQQRELAR